MSDKPDPFHLGECIMSPIWLQQSAEAEALVLSRTPPPAPVSPQPAQPSSSPGSSSCWLLSLARLPLFLPLGFFSAIAFAPFSHRRPLSVFQPLAGLGLTGRAHTTPLGTALFIHSLIPPAPPRSCPDLKIDTPNVRSCPMSHMLEPTYKGTASPPLSGFPSQMVVEPTASTLASKLHI